VQSPDECSYFKLKNTKRDGKLNILHFINYLKAFSEKELYSISTEDGLLKSKIWE
jgi:hypothetical protein